jgi:hypothetical protein
MLIQAISSSRADHHAELEQAPSLDDYYGKMCSSDSLRSRPYAKYDLSTIQLQLTDLPAAYLDRPELRVSRIPEDENTCFRPHRGVPQSKTRSRIAMARSPSPVNPRMYPPLS